MTMQTPQPQLPPATPTLAEVKRFLVEHPDDPDGLNSLGVLQNQGGEREAAILQYRRALAVAPDHAVVWNNLALISTATGRHAQAIACARVAVALAPDNPTACLSLTAALYKSGDFATDFTVLERLIRLAPDDSSLPWGRAQIRLHQGDYAQGFADYEARYWLREYHYRLHRGPRWDGGSLDGRFVMVTLEQGFGDTLLMARYLPMLKARGARRVIVELRDELRRLFAALEGVDAFIAKDAAPTPIYHVHTSIMSLPLRFGTTIDSVPPPVRLTVPDEARAKAARLLGPEDGRLKVGIVWSGSDAFADNAIRATSLERFLRFAGIPGVRLYSLQKGPPEEELRALPAGTPITALGPELEDFTDTAAVVERLDLVVMTDSSVAHLAGSLGTPVWTLIQHVPYWVYGMTGATTPWYPSMRLYRQGPEEDWEPVFDAVERDLQALAARRAADLLEPCGNP
ncbi:tetratricopeptide repeat protein [Azospirillum sp. YIM B02556]|uniref:Tetratricopeptide repeat protein n=1 Tax=Azospirillum endophyticum TaxID=2800326 RepID=A0ABS1FBG0_9PROT|nr:tetratricopeptide repeat protein [Azospirillum endophyticum]MBK1840764.1 tetratricopeptide repeat protein [Azospirillum endophyticum]